MTEPTRRVVWITGAGTGIGEALAERCAAHGDIVLATARTETRLSTLADRISRSGGFCRTAVCDVRNDANVASVAKQFLAEFGRIDVLVNNAGVTSFKDFLRTTVEIFDEVVDTNLRGLFLVTSSVLPSMVAAKRGTIINVLSFAAKVTYERSSAYAASKAGAEAMMNVLRAELRREGIGVINVHPGATLTPIWHPSHQEKFKEQMMNPADVARAIYEASVLPDSVMVEELVIRPQSGDLSV